MTRRKEIPLTAQGQDLPTPSGALGNQTEFSEQPVAADGLWQAMPLPAVVLDPADCIALVNSAAEDFLTASRKSLLGRNFWDWVQAASGLRSSFDRARDTGAQLVVNDTVLHTRPNADSPVPCSLHCDTYGDRPGFMTVILTPRELAGRMEPGQTARSAAQSAAGLAQMLAHEIKNPLAGITGAAQLLAMSLESEGQELTDLIVAECRRVVGLLDQVDHFGNLRAARLAPCNIHDVLTRARQSAEVGCAAHMKIKEIYDPSLPLAHADADQLLQVILNLMRNASEAAGPQGGTLTLRSAFQHGFKLRRTVTGSDQRHLPLQIEIQDDGPGVPAELKDRIFDPFVSGRPNGTGLGLALASKIISDHGGVISLSESKGRTIFRISLAVAPDATSAAGSLETQEPPEARSSISPDSGQTS